ncbi:MAG: hypothetical protein IPH88_18205 [Bacteroidales bacterium]|nr:hypothetical protein [Bacteroidales bacterium]
MLIGSFEIIDMGIGMNGNHISGFSIKIFDHIKKSVRPYNVQSWPYLDSFKKEIFPLLKRLNELGSWESYELMLEVDDLRIKNKELSEKIKLLEKTIKQNEETSGKQS